MPFLVSPSSIDSESLILVLAYGTPSLLEAQCVFGDKAKLSMPCGDIAVADISSDTRFRGYSELAGVHKIALPLPPIDSPELAETIEFPERNFNFSLSLYCSRGDPEAEHEDLSQQLLLSLRDLGLKKANLIRSRTGSELYSEKVVSRAALDFVVFPIGATHQWGVTVYVPEVGEFQERSTGRPYVTSSISLSSRLARMLVNIAGVSRGKAVLDPFCGSGTILGEALLKGAECIGVDRNHGTVERAKKNLEWLLSRQQRRQGRGKKEEESTTSPSYSVVVGDATNLRRYLGDRMVDAVISEPILIPKLSSPPTVEKARRLIKHAGGIYSEALYEMGGVLRPGGRVVLVAPSVRTVEGKDVTLKLEDVEEAGLRPFQPPNSPRYEYPLQLSHQSTRWIRREVYALERF